MNPKIKNLLFWPILIGIALVLVQVANWSRSPQDEITYSEFLNKVENGRVASIEIQTEKIVGRYKNDEEFFAYKPQQDPELIAFLRRHNVNFEATPAGDGLLYSILINWFPIVLFIGFWFYMMRSMQGGGNKALSFGKSRAKLQSDASKKVTFQDVAGCDEAKEELREIVEFLKDPHKFEKLGGKIPKGVLLMGNPGTGKTLLARAVAGEADVPFFSISGSDFVEMFVGVGASRVRDLFEKGKKNAPCIIFIDEIDAVGRHRGAGLGGGHDEREQTLNQLLVEMDGFESNTGVILIAATNRPDVLDPALLRPGRFDRQVVVDYPDVRGREQILRVHVKNIKVANEINLEVLAKGTPGFSGADLANMVNEAALLAARENAERVAMTHFEQAKEKVMMGPERKSLVMSDQQKRLVAYHEAGHAIVSTFCDHHDPLHKVTIIPRGRAMGMASYLPKEDKLGQTRGYLTDLITTLMGGRVAEEIIFGEDEVTTGAGNDIERATEIARRMVCTFGMSENLGPLKFGKEDQQVFLGREITSQRNYSEDTAIKIDTEVRRLVVAGYERARHILTTNLATLHRLSEMLLEKESLEGQEVMDMIRTAAGLGGELPGTPEVGAI